jgi:DnaK suppressor protein
MLNLNRQNFDKIRRTLLRQEKSVKEELKRLQKDDPVFDDGLAESIEPGTSSWMADVHSRAVAIKDNLQGMLSRTQKSLASLKKGTYGKCEKCGKQIEPARLLAIPTATLCIKDSKKATK